MNYSSKEECTQGMVHMIWWAFAIAVALVTLLYMHFCQVMYTHWKNSHLPMSKGGLVPDGEAGGLAQRMDEEE